MPADFKTAYLRLQQIAQIIKSTPVIDIEELLKLQSEAKELHEFLQSKLLISKTDEQPQ